MVFVPAKLRLASKGDPPVKCVVPRSAALPPKPGRENSELPIEVWRVERDCEREITLWGPEFSHTARPCPEKLRATPGSAARLPFITRDSPFAERMPAAAPAGASRPEGGAKECQPLPAPAGPGAEFPKR